MSHVSDSTSRVRLPAVAVAAAPFLVPLIEQSPLLDLANLALGIVSVADHARAIAVPSGRKRKVMVLKGKENHPPSASQKTAPKRIRGDDKKPGESNIIANYRGRSYAMLPGGIKLLVARFLLPSSLQGDIKANMAEYAYEKCLIDRHWKKIRSKIAIAKIPILLGVSKETYKRIKEFLIPNDKSEIIFWNCGRRYDISFFKLMRVNKRFSVVVRAELTKTTAGIEGYIYEGKFDAMVKAWKGRKLTEMLTMLTKQYQNDLLAGLVRAAIKHAPEDYQKYIEIKKEDTQCTMAAIARQVTSRSVKTTIEQEEVRPLSEHVALPARPVVKPMARLVAPVARRTPSLVEPDARPLPKVVVAPARRNPLLPLEEGFFNIYRAAPPPTGPGYHVNPVLLPEKEDEWD